MNKDYILSVPVMSEKFNHHMNREKTVETMKKMGVRRVMAAQESNCTSGEAKEKAIKNLKESADYLHACGFEVGAWFWTFYNTLENDFTRMVSVDGTTSRETVCPTDEKYCEEMCSFLKDCARTGIDLIMFDDDYRYGFLDMGFGCLCKNHLKRISEYLNEPVTFEQVSAAILNGGKNKYRDAFLAVNGNIFEEFAVKCREAVDSVNPDIRMGFCSCITSWDIDGTTPDRISRLLAGNTKPFYRLIGAPYWAALNAWGHSRLSYVIEQERLEASRREDKNIEIFSEGDTYPRPRYRVPAAYLEGFDQVLRADGCTDGILKYSFDYHSSDNYEKGYNDTHIRNLKTYDAIDEFFGDKETIGVRVFDNMCKFNSLTMPTNKSKPLDAQNLAFSISARFLASNSLPITYSGNEYSGIAFGEDARIFTSDMLKNGIITDFSGAMILKEKGFDTGIISESGTVGMSGSEYFASGEITNGNMSAAVHLLDLDKNAKIKSYIIKDGKIPVFYEYENENGFKFAIYTFDGYNAEEATFRNYERQKQVIEALEWMCGKLLPAVCKGNPDLYILTKEKGNKLSVGLWNFFPDIIYDAKVELPKNIKSFKIFGGEAKAENNTLIISRIDAYGLAAVEIEF